MTKRYTVFAGALLVSSALVACAGGETPEAATSEVTQPAAAEATTLTLDTVNAAHAQLEELAGAPLNSIQVQSMLISANGNLSVDALDPAKPTELNQYVAYPDGRTDIRPYDYGGAERYEDLLATMFAGDLVSAETIVGSYEDSFNRVEGDRADLKASGVNIAQNTRSGAVEVYIVNGPERDRQTVYYDPAGAFLRVE